MKNLKLVFVLALVTMAGCSAPARDRSAEGAAAVTGQDGTPAAQANGDDKAAQAQNGQSGKPATNTQGGDDNHANAQGEPSTQGDDGKSTSGD
jgi:hypothetical protein